MSRLLVSEPWPARWVILLVVLFGAGCAESGPQIGPHVDDLTDENPLVRAMAAMALGKLGPDARRAVPALISTLREPGQNRVVRGAVVIGLARIGEAAVPDLIEALKNPVPETVNDAFLINASINKALGDIGEPAVPDLIALLAHEEYGVRSSAVGALLHVGPDAEPAVPRLAEMLVNNDESETLRMDVAGALGRIGPNAKSAIPYLIEALDDAASMTGAGGEAICYYTIEALGKIGPDAKPAMPALENLQCYQSQRVRTVALVAMESISSDSVTTSIRTERDRHPN